MAPGNKRYWPADRPNKKVVKYLMKSYTKSFEQFNENRMNVKKGPGDGLSWYYGIADCHGIESFIKSVDRDRPEMSDARQKAADLYKKAEKEDRLKHFGLSDEGGEKTRKEAQAAEYDAELQRERQTMGMMSIRCGANTQRWSIVYKVLLQDEVAEMVEDLQLEGDSLEALNLIKRHALEVQIARTGGLNPEKTWAAIPNPSLDPMY